MINSEKSLEKERIVPQKKPYRSYRKRNQLNPAKKPDISPPKVPEKTPVKKPGEKEVTKKRQNIIKKLSESKPMLLYLAFLCTAVLVVAQSTMIAQLNYQVIKTENKLETLNNERTLLEMKVIEQKTPERIEKIAVEELEMRNPGRNDVINIE